MCPQGGNSRETETSTSTINLHHRVLTSEWCSIFPKVLAGNLFNRKLKKIPCSKSAIAQHFADKERAWEAYAPISTVFSPELDVLSTSLSQVSLRRSIELQHSLVTCCSTFLWWIPVFCGTTMPLHHRFPQGKLKQNSQHYAWGWGWSL